MTVRNEEAERAFRAAIKLQEKLATDFPAVSQYRADLAHSHNQLGGWLAKQGRSADAEAAFRAALKPQEQLVADFPTVLAYSQDLGLTYMCLAKLYLERDSTAGLEWSAKAIHTLNGVLAKDEHIVAARGFLGTVYYERGRYFYVHQRYAEAVPDLGRAIELTDQESKRDYIRVRRADALVRTGQTAQAVAEADSLTQGNNVPGDTLYTAAWIYALASAALKDNNQQAENYAVKAIALLRRAQAAGFFQEPARVADFKKNTDFDALRSRADYQRLIHELEETMHQGGK
jgi:tetratricopeptide (TPR) repeat protein